MPVSKISRHNRRGPQASWDVPRPQGMPPSPRRGWALRAERVKVISNRCKRRNKYMTNLTITVMPNQIIKSITRFRRRGRRICSRNRKTLWNPWNYKTWFPMLGLQLFYHIDRHRCRIKTLKRRNTWDWVEPSRLMKRISRLWNLRLESSQIILKGGHIPVPSQIKNQPSENHKWICILAPNVQPQPSAI